MLALAGSAAVHVQPDGSRTLQPEAYPLVLKFGHERRELIERLTGEILHIKTRKCGLRPADDSNVSTSHAGACAHGDASCDRRTYYVHVHKAGGSLICQLAKQNNESFDGFALAHNCNCKRDGPNAETHGWHPGYDRRCQAREQQLTSSFQMVERWMDSDTCGMRRAIMVRDPLDRIISNALFEKKFISVSKIMEAIKPGAKLGLEEPLALQEKAMVVWGTAAWDNFLVRTLGGPETFRIPARGLHREHLRRAKERLRDFEIVMMLDEFDTDSAQLAHVLGWTELVADAREITACNGCGHPEMRNDAQSNPFTEEELQTLVKVNALDFELVCYARKLARARTARARDAGVLGAGHQLKELRARQPS
eukprot:Transcript_22381.p1 GENE.Transcript_22381~~Transcript_22381.p1  ORF type:complete len:396 (-),score=47.07 Transcript_22381:83-1180(-)